MVAAWFKMNSLPQHDVSDTKVAFGKFFWLETIGFIGAGIGVTLLLADWGDTFDKNAFKLLKLFSIVLIAVIITLGLLRYATQKQVKDNLVVQFKIFDNKHNWIMTWLYIMTFGSFIGFSAAFPKLILDNFGYLLIAVASLVPPHYHPQALVGAIVAAGDDERG